MTDSERHAFLDAIPPDQLAAALVAVIDACSMPRRKIGQAVADQVDGITASSFARGIRRARMDGSLPETWTLGVVSTILSIIGTTPEHVARVAVATSTPTVWPTPEPATAEPAPAVATAEPVTAPAIRMPPRHLLGPAVVAVVDACRLPAREIGRRLGEVAEDITVHSFGSALRRARHGGSLPRSWGQHVIAQIIRICGATPETFAAVVDAVEVGDDLPGEGEICVLDPDRLPPLDLAPADRALAVAAERLTRAHAPSGALTGAGGEGDRDLLDELLPYLGDGVDVSDLQLDESTAVLLRAAEARGEERGYRNAALDLERARQLRAEAEALEKRLRLRHASEVEGRRAAQ